MKGKIHIAAIIAVALTLLCIFLPKARAQTVYTPKAGSPERQTICDAARVFVLNNYATGTLPQPIVFKIEHLAVADGYCNFEAVPIFKDGSYVGSQYIPDIVFNFCLQKTGSSWRVIVDLSRTDVPDRAEVDKIRSSLPPDFPSSVFSPPWRRLLGE